MTTDFTPTGTPLVNGMVDPQHPWVMWITRPDGKVEAYGYPPTDAGNNQLFADYRAAKQLGLSVQTRILPPETKPMSFEALRRLGGRRAQYTRAFLNNDFDLMLRHGSAAPTCLRSGRFRYATIAVYANLGC